MVFIFSTLIQVLIFCCLWWDKFSQKINNKIRQYHSPNYFNCNKIYNLYNLVSSVSVVLSSAVVVSGARNYVKEEYGVKLGSIISCSRRKLFAVAENWPGCQPNLAPPTHKKNWLGLGSLGQNELFGQSKLSGRALYDDGQMINSNVINHVTKERLGWICFHQTTYYVALIGCRSIELSEEAFFSFSLNNETYLSLVNKYNAQLTKPSHAKVNEVNKSFLFPLLSLTRKPSQNELIISAGHVKNYPKTPTRQMNESLIRRHGWQKNETLTRRHGWQKNETLIRKTQSGGERFVHLPGKGLWILFHVTCIGTVLVASKIIRLFLLGLWIQIFGYFFTWLA